MRKKVLLQQIEMLIKKNDELYKDNVCLAEELEKKKAQATIRDEIIDVSTMLTEKMLSREINEEDHRELISSFIDGIGEDDGHDS